MFNKKLPEHIQAIVKSALNDADADTKGTEEFQLWSTLSIQMKTTNKSKLRGKWSQCLCLVMGCVCGTNVCCVHAPKKPNNSFHNRLWCVRTPYKFELPLVTDTVLLNGTCSSWPLPPQLIWVKLILASRRFKPTKPNLIRSGATIVPLSWASP